MSKPAKRKRNRHVSRAERRLIRRQEARFPALGSAVKTLLDIHSLEARAVRDPHGKPWRWIVEDQDPPHVHGTRWPKKRHKFSMDTQATLEHWQQRCANPSTWDDRIFIDFETDWASTRAPMTPPRVYTHDLSTSEGRIAAYCDEATGQKPLGYARDVREGDEV